MKDAWFLQIQDRDYNVLLLNYPLGTYSKNSKWVTKAAEKIAAQYPAAHRWEVRKEPYTNRVVI